MRSGRRLVAQRPVGRGLDAQRDDVDVSRGRGARVGFGAGALGRAVHGAVHVIAPFRATIRTRAPSSHGSSRIRRLTSLASRASPRSPGTTARSSTTSSTPGSARTSLSAMRRVAFESAFPESRTMPGVCVRADGSRRGRGVGRDRPGGDELELVVGARPGATRDPVDDGTHAAHDLCDCDGAVLGESRCDLAVQRQDAVDAVDFDALSSDDRVAFQLAEQEPRRSSVSVAAGGRGRCSWVRRAGSTAIVSGPAERADAEHPAIARPPRWRSGAAIADAGPGRRSLLAESLTNSVEGISLPNAGGELSGERKARTPRATVIANPRSTSLPSGDPRPARAIDGRGGLLTAA